MTFNLLRPIGLLLILIMALACGGGSGDGGNKAASDADATGKPVSGGTLTVAMFGDVVNFDSLRTSDVYATMVSAQVVESLFEVDQNGKIVGRLVETTENPEPNVYVWKLRKGIKFSDGSDFDSEAVKFNIERHRSAGSTSVRAVDVKDITSLEAPDSNTVRITLKAPDRSFPEKFTSGAGRMFNPKAVAALGSSLQRDLTNAGTGPFKFVNWVKDTQVVLDRNPSYWQKDKEGNQLPYLDRMVFAVIPDENTRLANLKAGEVDALAGNPPYKDIKDLRSGSEISLKEIPGLGFSVIELNTAKEPFNNAALRRAVSFALDREQIKKTVFFDSGKVLDTIIPESLAEWYQKDASYHPYLKQDPASVKRELTAGGKPNGFKFSLQISSGSPVLEQTAVLIQDQLKPFGIEAEIQRFDMGTILANGRAGEEGQPAKFEALILGWSGGGRLDADGNASNLLYTKAGSNFSAYSNRDLDKAIDDGRNLLDQSKAKAAYDQAIKIANEQQPLLVYYNPPQISSVRNSVRNYPQTYNGYWGASDFYKIWKTR